MHRRKSNKTSKHRSLARRHLRMEVLEDRRLLSLPPNGGDFSHSKDVIINFDIREDMNSDGDTSGDPPAAGVYVELGDLNDGGSVVSHGSRLVLEDAITCVWQRQTWVDPNRPYYNSVCPDVDLPYESFSSDPRASGLRAGNLRLFGGSGLLNWEEARDGADPILDHATIEKNVALQISRGTLFEGWVYEDVNANGVRDDDEDTIGVPDLRVHDVHRTDDNGNFSYRLYPTYPHKTTHEIKPWIPKIPGTSQPQYVQTSVFPELERTSGASYDLNVGLFEYATAHGTVYYDTNGNGIQDNGEQPMEGATVFFDQDHDGDRDGISVCFPSINVGEKCAITDDQGHFELMGGFFDDELQIESTHATGALRISGRNQNFRVDSSGQIMVVNLGVASPGRLYGRYYRDLDVNQEYDHGRDPQLRDEAVLLDLYNDGSVDRVIQTDSQGVYDFWLVPPGEHRIVPAIEDVKQIIKPSPAGYVITIPADDTLRYFDISVSRDAKLVDGDDVDVVEEDDGREGPVLQQRKRELFQSILTQITSRSDEFWDQRGQHLFDLVKLIVQQEGEGGYIPVSLTTLDKVKQIVDLQTTIMQESRLFTDFLFFTAEDVQRLGDLSARAIESSWKVLTDPLYRQTIVDRGFDISLAVGDAIYDAMGRAWDRIKEERTDLIFDAMVYAVDNLGKREFYEELAYDMAGIDLFKKAFWDTSVPVEQRLGYFALGYAQILDSIALGVGAAKAGTALAGASKARLIQFERQLAEQAREHAFKMFDNPQMALTVKGAMLDLFESIRLHKGGLKDLASGSRVPPKLMSQMGYTQKQIDALATIAKQKNISMQFRTTNPKSTYFIKNELALEKPLTIKAKTINPQDIHLGYDAADEGLVGLLDPQKMKKPELTVPCINDPRSAECALVTKRHKDRVDEFNKLVPELNSSKYRIDDAGRIIDLETNKPFAGDIDPVAFYDANGKQIDGEAYDALVEELRESGANIQHGAETNVIDDIMRNSKNADFADPLTGEIADPKKYAAWLKEREKAIKLFFSLEQNHYAGREMVIEFGADGLIYKVDIDKLAPGSYTGRIDDVAEAATTISRRKEQMKQMAATTNLTAVEAGKLGPEALLQKWNNQRLAQAEQVTRVLDGLFKTVAFTVTDFAEMTPEEFLVVLQDDPSGVNIEGADQSGGEGESNNTVSEADILSKLQPAVEEGGLSDFQIGINEQGDWHVSSDLALVATRDVNTDAFVSSIDALMVINHLNSPGDESWATPELMGFDVSRDGYASAIDALLVINHLNRHSGLSGEGERGQAQVWSDPSAVPLIRSSAFGYSNAVREATDAFKQSRVEEIGPAPKEGAARQSEKLTRKTAPLDRDAAFTGDWASAVDRALGVDRIFDLDDDLAGRWPGRDLRQG